MIVLERVTKTYPGNIKALKGISLKVKKGEFVFVVGDSGSGKSTLIRLLLRELKPTEGSIMVNGFQVEKLPRYKVPKLRRSMGVVFQDFRLLKDRNVYENVAFAQRVILKSNREIRRNVPTILATVGLAGKYKSKVNQLSGGEQQMLAIARGLMARPKMLMLDEPSLGLAPIIVNQIMDTLRSIAQSGTTILLVEQNAVKALSLCDRAYVMNVGRIVLEDSGKELLANEKLMHAYLG